MSAEAGNISHVLRSGWDIGRGNRIGSSRRPGYNLCRSTFAKDLRMLSSTNFWMCFAGLVYLVAGVFILRKEISAARGWDKLITLGSLFIAVALAVFAPEHFRGGPVFVQNIVPSWFPGPPAFSPGFI